jgi:hypothetical protein
MALVRESAGTINLTAVATATGPFGALGLETAIVSAVWTGLTSLDAQLELQCSADGIEWNRVRSPDNPTTMDTTAPDNSQIFELNKIVAAFYRLAYIPNSNTAGSLTFKFIGSGRGA